MTQQRNVGLCVFLTIITCGLYGLYWMVCLTDDSNQCTGQGTTSGGMVLLFSLITCGIYTVYWNYVMGDKLDRARARRGEPSGNQAILYLVLSLFGLDIISLALIQRELNRLSVGNYGF